MIKALMVGDVPFKADVFNCARCGQDHKQLEFKEFQHPVVDIEGDWNYWVICPSNSEPILLRSARIENEHTNSL